MNTANFNFSWDTLPPMLNVTLVLMYAAVLVVITSLLSLRTRDPDPMLGGRNMPWWLVGSSILGTNLSSIAFLIIPALGYTLDINLIANNLADPVLSATIVFFTFVTFLRKTQDASIYTLLKSRFGMGISLYISGSFIVFYIFRAGLILFLVGQALHFITETSVESTILISGFLVVFYTYMTGIEGVMWTDFFQSILLTLAGLLSLWFIGDSTWGSAIQQQLHLEDLANIISSEIAQGGAKLTESFGITLLFYVVTGVSYLVSDQTMGQRYLVARSDSHAKRGLLAAGFCTPFILGIFILIGISLFTFYKINPALLPTDLATEQVFGHFIANQFPNGLLGIAVVGILAAAMSSIDTGINSSSTVFYCNFWEPFSRQTDSKVLNNMSVMRSCSFAFGLTSIIAALLIYRYSESIIDVWLKSGSLILDGALGLFILMRISPRVGRKSAIAGLVCGMPFLTWAIISRDIPWIPSAPFHYMWGLPVATLIIVTVGLITSRIVIEVTPEISAPFIHTEAARASIARKRKRAKKNMFADSIRPKPSYQVYASVGAIIALLIYFDQVGIRLPEVEPKLLLLVSACLFAVTIGPFVIKNYTSRTYLYCNLALLTIALPFASGYTMFMHPQEPIYGYLFLGCVAAMGTMVGWTMLSIGIMTGSSLASLAAIFDKAKGAAPENWMLVTLGTVAIFIFYAMDAAKEKMAEERTLEKIHHILKHVSKKMVSHVLNLTQSRRELTLLDIDQLAHSAEDIAATIDSLKGATNMNPEYETQELSIRESLQMALSRVPFLRKGNNQDLVTVECEEDFTVLGARDVFEAILLHLLENSVHYLEKGNATCVHCHIDAKRRIFTISNDGPPIEPRDVPHIFNLGYGTKGGLGIGLAYCKTMLEGMRSGIRLTSKPYQKKAEFKIYFPYSTYNNLHMLNE